MKPMRIQTFALCLLAVGCERAPRTAAPPAPEPQARPRTIDLSTAREALKRQKLDLSPELVQKALPQLEAAVQRQVDLEEQVARAPRDLALTFDLTPRDHQALALVLSELVARERLRRVALVSDATWKVADGATVSTGWQGAAFDDSVWQPAVPQGRLGVSPWQPVSSFATPSNAEWIWYYASNWGDDRSTVLFRRRFVAPREELTLTITADNEFEVFVDGIAKGTGRDWQHAVSVPLRLKAGHEHLIAVKVVNWSGPGGLLVDLR